MADTCDVSFIHCKWCLRLVARDSCHDLGAGELVCLGCLSAERDCDSEANDEVRHGHK